MKNDRTKELDLRSDDIKELIGFMPEGLIRWASGAFLFVLLILIGVSWFVRYPDIVTLPVMLTTENPPIRSQNKANGKIEAIFVKDSTQVVEGQRLALIESGAKYDDILRLKNYINGIEKGDYQTFYRSKPIEGLLLGTIQSNYVRFLEAHNSFSILYAQTIDNVKTKALNKEIKVNEKIGLSLDRQYNLYQEEFNLSQKKVERGEELHKDGNISLADLEAIKSLHAQNSRQLENFKDNFNNNSLQKQGLETQIAEIQQNRQVNIDNRYESLKSALISLKNDLQLWEQNYFVVAPIKGIVSVPFTTQPYKTTTIGEELFTILPNQNTEKIVGLLEIPATLPGKININATVNIKLDGYPYLRYGILQGKLKNMTLVPVKNTYLAQVGLINPLVTDFGDTIIFRQEMRGTADIITEDKSIFMRLFEQFSETFKQKNENSR
jgi:multidrug efflux pump subunit AcrA (membrane-fusion protein)